MGRKVHNSTGWEEDTVDNADDDIDGNNSYHDSKDSSTSVLTRDDEDTDKTGETTQRRKDEKVDEAYKFIKSVQVGVSKKDDFSVYGEILACIMRNAKQNSRAVPIAKHHIDNILFTLEMGKYDNSGRNSAQSVYSPRETEKYLLVRPGRETSVWLCFQAQVVVFCQLVSRPLNKGCWRLSPGLRDTKPTPRYQRYCIPVITKSIVFRCNVSASTSYTPTVRTTPTNFGSHVGKLPKAQCSHFKCNYRLATPVVVMTGDGITNRIYTGEKFLLYKTLLTDLLLNLCDSRSLLGDVPRRCPQSRRDESLIDLTRNTGRENSTTFVPQGRPASPFTIGTITYASAPYAADRKHITRALEWGDSLTPFLRYLVLALEEIIRKFTIPAYMLSEIAGEEQVRRNYIVRVSSNNKPVRVIVPASVTGRDCNRYFQKLGTGIDCSRPIPVADNRISESLATIGPVPGQEQQTTDELTRGNGGCAVRLLASHQDEPGSIPGRGTPGFSQVGIAPDDAAIRRVFSGISRFPHPCSAALLHSYHISLSSALNTSVLRGTKMLHRQLLHFNPKTLNSGFDNLGEPQIHRIPPSASYRRPPRLIASALSQEDEPSRYRYEIKATATADAAARVPLHGFPLLNAALGGKNVHYDFMKRHPELALRTDESTNIMQDVGIHKIQVDVFFFNELGGLMEKNFFPPSRNYSAYETGISTVHKNSKVISLKGKRQCGKLTSGKRGRNVMLMFCMACFSWMRKNPGQRINEYNIAVLACAAYTKVCSLEIAQKDISCTSIKLRRFLRFGLSSFQNDRCGNPLASQETGGDVIQFDRSTTQTSVEPTSGPSGFYESGEGLEKISPAKHNVNFEKETRKCLKSKKPLKFDDATVTQSSEQGTSFSQPTTEGYAYNKGTVMPFAHISQAAAQPIVNLSLHASANRTKGHFPQLLTANH
ncbi:hypothetical protein PR048_006346 [Dryococelus australis]|uniref:Uncharacterized protein n=1 Tax=Dryococelus australis TaxID=614101 RepID=A0ABQ9IAT0_9NEOP|nr:hypothetical protein PR048_006346 [Dryococelus australis]